MFISSNENMTVDSYILFYLWKLVIFVNRHRRKNEDRKLKFRPKARRSIMKMSLEK